MDFSISLQEFTELFRSIVPPKGLAYVGAGSGSSMGPYLNGAFQVGIVAEADVTDYEKLLKVVNDHQGWIVHRHLRRFFIRRRTRMKVAYYRQRVWLSSGEI